MDFFTLIESRYSVRAYTAQPVEPAKLEQLLRAAQVAPTAANYQPFRLAPPLSSGVVLAGAAHHRHVHGAG